MAIRKFVKKPVEVEVGLFDPEREDVMELLAWINSNSGKFLYASRDKRLTIVTLNGPVVVTPGEYVIKGVEGEFYPCAASILTKTYSEVTGG